MTPLLAALALLQTQPQFSPSPAAPAVADTLPRGTSVTLTTVDALDSRSLRQGQRIALRVASDVRIAGRVAIPAGAPAVGEIEALSPKGMVGKAGSFTLKPMFVELAGRRLFLEGSHEARGKGATTATAVAGVLVTSLAIFVTGKSATLPPGTAVTAQVRTDTSLPPLSR